MTPQQSDAAHAPLLAQPARRLDRPAVASSELQSAAPPVAAPNPSLAKRYPARVSGPVVPHELGWGRQLLAWGIYGLIKLTATTLRCRLEIDPAFGQAARGPVVFIVWHNRLPLCLIAYRLLLQVRGRPHQLAAMVSASQDGAVVARILELFGAQPVRGSTSRRGPQALLELTTWAERDYDLALTPDGPRGPCYVVQPGPILLARLTGLPIIPVSYSLSWKIRLNTWDRFQVPLPGSRFHIKVGAPVWVPRNSPDEQMESLRAQLQEQLRSLTED